MHTRFRLVQKSTTLDLEDREGLSLCSRFKMHASYCGIARSASNSTAFAFTELCGDFSQTSANGTGTVAHTTTSQWAAAGSE